MANYHLEHDFLKALVDSEFKGEPPSEDDFRELYESFRKDGLEKAVHDEKQRRYAATADHHLIVIVKPGCPYIPPYRANETGSFPPELAARLIAEGWAKEIE